MEQAAVASCFDPIGKATVIMLSRIEFTRLLGAIKGDTIVNCDAVFGAGIATVHHGYVYCGFGAREGASGLSRQMYECLSVCVSACLNVRASTSNLSDILSALEKS